MAWKRIGLFGGTFDPIHIGHLVAAVNARHQCELDVVLMEVAPNPWQKIRMRELTDAEVRYRAVSAALEGSEGLVASRLEIERGGITYSVDTLRQLRERYPEAQLFLIGGSDMASRLDEWHEAGTVAAMADFVWVNRPGIQPFEMDRRWRIHHVHMPPIDLSSSAVRKRIAVGESVDYLVPFAALDVIRSNGLYAGGK
jgi:nicotinate-nucleotide adenylyltransferase